MDETDFSLADATGDYDWIFEGYEPYTESDWDIEGWLDGLVEVERERCISAIEERGEEIEYPFMLYTTTNIIENAEEYKAAKLREMEEAIPGEREAAKAAILEWLKGDSNANID